MKIKAYTFFQIVHSFYSWQFQVSYILCLQQYLNLMSLWREAGRALGALACWHEDEFNIAAHLFSHLHVCKGPVIVADVEQADSLREQPTKTKSKWLTPTTPSASESIWVVTTVRINHYTASPASNRTAEMCDYTSLSPSVSLRSLMFTDPRRKPQYRHVQSRLRQ